MTPSSTSPETGYPRGSEWRKWDLQVHTPFSELNTSFGNDFNAYAKRLLEAALNHNIIAVGVTDYFSIGGYKKLRGLLRDASQLANLVGPQNAARLGGVLFLPNIEFRSSVIVRDPDGADSRVTFHVIFSDDVNPDDIEENFLRELKFTAESTPGGVDEAWSLTIANLERLGAMLKEQHEGFRARSDLFVGMMNAVVDHSDGVAVLEGKPSIFKDKYLIAVPCDEDLSKVSWEGQGHLQRKLLIQKSHFLFSSSAGTRSFALGQRHPTIDEFLHEFKTMKPCLHSSDAHAFDDLFAPDQDRYTWIKADPTYMGLRQVLNEPQDRVFIGPMPPSQQRVADRPTRVIDAVKIRRRSDATTTDKWFDVSLLLNPGLIAIIGNKGSGKSALADVLGLLGNTPRHASFSFLSPDKFRNPKTHLAGQFQATFLWVDGTEESAPRLDEDPTPETVEKVKYIPQNYLEDICNEIELGKGSRFYAELEQVIFSYVPPADRLGFSTLEELLQYRSEEAAAAIQLLVGEIAKLNREIAVCEDRLSPQYAAALQAQLDEKCRELEAHEQTKPAEIDKPEQDEGVQQESKETSELITQKQSDLEAIIQQIAGMKDQDSSLAKRESLAEKLIDKLENLESQVQRAVEDVKDDLVVLGLQVEEVVSISVDTAPIKVVLRDIKAQRDGFKAQLDHANEQGLECQRAKVTGEIEDLQAKLSAPQRRYQAYLNSLEEWQRSRAAIAGTRELTGSITHLESLLSELKQLPPSLSRLSYKRDHKMLEVYRHKQRLRGYYGSYYGAVQQFLINQPIPVLEGFGFTFNVSITQRGFSEKFLSFVHQGKIGPFSGIDEGGQELKNLLDATNFDSALATLRFTRRLLGEMKRYRGSTLEVKDQLVSGVSPVDVSDFIFSLGYLSPVYNLQWDGKGLEQLSPGERGNLLLIFYLLVDKDDMPLVIDQPEENLDNQTVFNTLVPCVKDAKKRRQIVMATHNPNLAVVCDAEQVIYAQIHKDRANEVTYESGSLEEPTINKHVVDVLEGTRPAFDRRDAVYLRR